MPSSYTTRLRAELQGTGENSGTWGTLLNTLILEVLEEAIAGVAAVAMSDANYTLTANNGMSDEARQAIIHLTGALTQSRNVICPTVEKLFMVYNATTGSQSIVFKTNAGSGITVPNGKKRLVYCDGTNVVDFLTDLPSGTTLNNGAIYSAGGTDVALADGGTGASLADPGADRILFWDDSGGAVTWLDLGTGLAITTTTLGLDAQLVDIAGLTPTNKGVIIGNGSNFVVDTTPEFTGLTVSNPGPAGVNVILDSNDDVQLDFRNSSVSQWSIVVDGTQLRLNSASNFVVQGTSATGVLDFLIAPTISGNVIYRAGGTDVAVADGGTGASDAATAITNLGAMKQGLVTIPVLAAAMQAATTNGAAAGTVETTTNKVLYRTLDFDTTTQEFAGFTVPMPKSYNNGTVTFQPIWTAASGSGTVVWALQAVAASDDDTIDAAYGTEQTSTDTLLTAGDVHVGPTSSAITIAGTLATGDMVFFRIKRNVAADTLGVDARLIGIRLFFTQNAADDT